MTQKIDPKLLNGIYKRKVANFHQDHVKQLLTLVCQLLGIADSEGVLDMGAEDDQKGKEDNGTENSNA